MKLFIFALLSINTTLASIIPENSLNIPANQKELHISKERFHELVDKVVTPYQSMMSFYGAAEFIVNRYWDDGKVNASAGKKKDTFLLNIYGGLARHKLLTEDAFMMVLCHEIGHLVGGAPTWKPFNQASSEGQADYFATLKCFKRITLGDNVKIKDNKVPEFARKRCRKVYATEDEYNQCKRSALAQLSLITLMSELAGLKNTPKFETPDPYLITVIMFNGYPNPQCRLDTLLAGSLCKNDLFELMDMNLYNKGVCSKVNGDDFLGRRPRCWYIGREDK